ncbi:MAG: UDP-N-acetylmuramoyl-L-alanine--D-glutamate ligase [Candidatus Pacebacteria bacterium]|nr:UDP-N-acetylmuramoyl-L-alanine--D-glutamate ligase [Candidatus Paceibacterota bacterium]
MKDMFKGKKITVMGLGLLGRGVGDTKFLAEQGAKEIIVTDLKTENDLKESVKQLEKYENIRFILGEHRLEDFKNRDFILKSADVPLDSVYIKEARENGVKVEMSTSLFAKFFEGTIVGITGTRGKTTVSYLIDHVLRTSGRKSFLGGNIQGVSTLAHLPESSIDEIAVLELDSWQLQGFGEGKISPHISVFTTFMPDHLNYYKNDLNAYMSDKANIFRFQKGGDFLILGEKVVRLIGTSFGLSNIKSKIITASPHDIPKDWDIKIPGEHNLYNIACATESLKALGISDDEIKEGVESFAGVPGRLEILGEKDGVKIYNDTTATTPDATLVGLRALTNTPNTILIFGGNDKGIDSSKLISEMASRVKSIVLLPGTGTDKVLPKLINENINLEKADSMEGAVKKAKELSNSGDIVLLSPGFASFGLFKNEYDRGDQYKKHVAEWLRE